MIPESTTVWALALKSAPGIHSKPGCGRPLTRSKVIEMKEREREEIKRLAKQPLPDVEKLLSELEQRLEALESKGPLPIEVEIWVRGARDSLALLREQIVLQLKHIEGKCDRIQAIVNRYLEKQFVTESRKIEAPPY